MIAVKFHYFVSQFTIDIEFRMMNQTTQENFIDNTDNNDNEKFVFEERADFISHEDLVKWTVESDFFWDIQKKILQKGAKLIVGPRGAGKTHQMKFAYEGCLHDKKKPLAIYVSFSKYYHLEPLLAKKTNAITLFHTWVLSKILLSTYQLLYELEKTDIVLYETESALSQTNLKDFVSQAEKGISHDWHDDVITSVTIDEVVNTIENLAIKLGKKRTILLLDDAALTLTPEYLIEFFDIFRSLKTINIAPKASVYPGTTVYGPRFHIGQDAEKVESWLKVENENYSQFMNDLIEKRLLSVTGKIPRRIIELFKYASFGIPRAFMGLLRSYMDSPSQTTRQRFHNVINEQVELMKGEYLSLSKKLPQYKLIVQGGVELHEKIVTIISAENKKLTNQQNQSEKQLQIGILREHNLKLDRMMMFLIEAGLLYKLKPIKGADRKEYDRYIPHLLFVIQSGAFSIGGEFNSRKMIQFLERKAKKHPVMRNFRTLLGDEEIQKIRLDLPSCQHCGTERLIEEQKFCYNCGKVLIRKSTFESCMRIKIDDLPITHLQKQRIREQTDLQTIGDLLSIPEPATELRKATSVGEVRAEKIYKTVMKFVEEFLA